LILHIAGNDIGLLNIGQLRAYVKEIISWMGKIMPNVTSPKSTPPGLLLAAMKACLTIEEPTIQTVILGPGIQFNYKCR
jgi:hypothetical protein